MKRVAILVGCNNVVANTMVQRLLILVLDAAYDVCAHDTLRSPPNWDIYPVCQQV